MPVILQEPHWECRTLDRWETDQSVFLETVKISVFVRDHQG
jgi:hypothetical protein